MAIYYCHQHDGYVDNDWFPCEEHEGELICPDCFELKDDEED